MAPAIIRQVLRRARLNRIRERETAEPVRRHERDHRSGVIPTDIKKLARFGSRGHRITGDRIDQSKGRAV